MCHLEGVGLLDYSPLAMGLLTVRAGGAAGRGAPRVGRDGDSEDDLVAAIVIDICG